MAAHTIGTLCDRLGCALASALRLPSTQRKEVAVIFRVDVQSFADVLTVLTKAEEKKLQGGKEMPTDSLLKPRKEETSICVF